VSALMMRKIPCLAVTAAFLSTGVLLAPSLSAQDLPKRKPGLWQQSMTTIGAPVPATSMTMCTDERMDRMLVQRSEDAERCTKQSVRRDGNAVLIEAVCTHKGTTVRTKGRFSGDFNSNYSGEMHSTFDPPMQGMKEMRQKIEARWLGPCKPGQKPGDTFVEGMGGMNVQEMMKGMDPKQMQEMMKGMDQKQMQEMMQQMQQMQQRAKPPQ
jgi:hypothetical protein